jgi:hypothetical protein
MLRSSLWQRKSKGAFLAIIGFAMKKVALMRNHAGRIFLSRYSAENHQK